ncbi:DUF2058 domain-containing protein [Parahaliea aestuarii]|uniref:DUF2058 domain-containing protein n=1 Tax=Parahaliea aestuarii TaxID=1852021 RepID=A0A5C8ZTN1_9GAMM|nr:DUF2058 domain-containing protein [Parahaliea aestuarii]TXS90631.1 DUF2058 domain-containing protein [Parahaliea aestuarii]
MSGSLKDQLLQAGLADAKRAKQFDKEKRKAARVARRSGDAEEDEIKAAARRAQAEKVQRDRELNQQLNEKAQRKAINAQIRQLIDNNVVDRSGGEINFHFTDGKQVKKLYVTAIQQKQLSAGRLCIAKQGDQYLLIPAVVADKIAERDASRIIRCEESDAAKLTQEEEEWYKDYEIPDDLMW